ncbi:hypothetical protein JS565_09100 [Salmonella enterica subsp. enterica serovar Senftenberg]|nr:hypothetical protein [Salmonella enterica subsp. enterica serovar Senftenberg]
MAGDIGRAVAHPELFLSEAKSHATCSAPAAAVPAASGGPKRVVAVTACRPASPMLMAAEAIETEAKNAAGG